jgi:hypothetical protein
LLPAALPVFTYQVIFRTNPQLHGAPLYLFRALRVYCQVMAIALVLVILSWIFPFVGGDHDVTAQEMQRWVVEGCGYNGCPPTSNIRPMAAGIVILFQVVVKFPLELLRLLPGLDWPIEALAKSTGEALAFMLRTGHLNHHFLWMVTVSFWLVALIPLWIVLWVGSLLLSFLEWL